MQDKNIPLLQKEDIDCRVQSVRENKSGGVGATLLLYKDARVDMRLLDDVYGSGNWQRTHEVIGGNLFCNIDLWDEDKKCWVRKQDVGTESYTEKEKGQASDSFKRAGFNVGIGRELYTAPFIYVQLEKGEYYGDPPKISPRLKFEVSEISYDDHRRISHLVICDNTGKERYRLYHPKTISAKRDESGSPKGRKPLPPLPGQNGYVCADCGKTLETYKDPNGKVVSLKAHATRSEEMFGRVLCLDCIKAQGKEK